jgi:hypothetical protein
MPTLILLQTLAFPTSDAAQFSSDPRTKYVPRSLLKGWQKSFDDPNNTMQSGEADLNRALLQRSFQTVGQMQSAGIPILAGTDTAGAVSVSGLRPS